MKQHILFLYCLLLLIFSSVCHAASFDCTQAKTEREKLVCSDSQLSKKDEELTSVYRKALKKVDDKEWLKNDQRKWIKDIDFRLFLASLSSESYPCDISCLKESYVERIAQLAFLIKAKDIPPLKTIKSNEEVCQKIQTGIETIESFSGKKLCGSPAPDCTGDTDEIPIKKLVSKGLVPSQIQFGEINYYSPYVTEVDINNNGLPDLWLSQWSGKEHCQDNEFLLRTKEGTYIHAISSSFDRLAEESDLCGGDELTLRKIDGLTYLIISGSSSAVFLLQPSGELRLICSF